MPDHPSWPAELVEKVASFLRETDPARMGCTCYWDEAGNPPPDCRCAERNAERDSERARKLLSALSGDLVPREEHEADLRRMGAEATSVVAREQQRFNAQADALAEALERLQETADWYRRCLEDVIDRRPVRGLDEARTGYDHALDNSRERLASYRSSSSTETEG